MIENFWILIIALIFDILIGEPPSVIHPVVWIGKLIEFFTKHAPKTYRLIYGFFMAISCISLSIILGFLVLSIDGIFGLIISGFVLKSTFSIRMLVKEALKIKKYLEDGNIEKVRLNLKAFVGRDTRGLNKYSSASAVIESLGESFVDGILSPLFYFFIFGLWGALAYRMINTLDSMVGYKKEPFYELGFASAKIDDIVNFVPARLSFVFILIASILFGTPFRTFKTIIKDHNKTASPNSGWSMSGFSGTLGVKLEKIGYHVIGNEFDEPEPKDIKRAVYLVLILSLIVVVGMSYLLIF